MRPFRRISLQRTDAAVMTMVNVVLCLLLVAWFLVRDDDRPARTGSAGEP